MYVFPEGLVYKCHQAEEAAGGSHTCRSSAITKLQLILSLPASVCVACQFDWCVFSHLVLGVCHGSKATVQIWNCSCHDSCNPSLLTPVSKRWEEFRTWNWHLTTENILWILYFAQVSGLGWEKKEERKSRWRYCMFWGWGFPSEEVYMNNDLFQEVFQPLFDFNWKIIK